MLFDYACIITHKKYLFNNFLWEIRRGRYKGGFGIMGRGKSRVNADSAYEDKTNRKIKNTNYNSNRNRITNGKLDIHIKNLRNSSGTTLVTRYPETVSGYHARSKFKKLVQGFEKKSHISVSDLSKQDLMFNVLNYTENHQAIIQLKDDCKQFLTYRFTFPDSVKLYLYKLFYPRVFDFIIDDKENDIIFMSDYIKDNFDSIYKNVEMLCWTIVWDAITIAIERYFSYYISIEEKYSDKIDPNEDVQSILENIKNVHTYENENNNFYNLVIHLLPSVLFFVKHSSRLYKAKVRPHKLIKYLRGDAFYAGNRSDESLDALRKAYSDCRYVLNNVFDFMEDIEKDNELSHKGKIPKPFTRLLNLYYINERSGIYDLDIINGNSEFEPYRIDGILSKYLINKMIRENYEQLKNLDVKETELLELSSIQNNPNYIINNITSRDYELLDYIITRASETMNVYYLIKHKYTSTLELYKNKTIKLRYKMVKKCQNTNDADVSSKHKGKIVKRKIKRMLKRKVITFNMKVPEHTLISIDKLTEIIDTLDACDAFKLPEMMDDYIGKKGIGYIKKEDYNRVVAYNHYFSPKCSSCMYNRNNDPLFCEYLNFKSKLKM